MCIWKVQVCEIKTPSQVWSTEPISTLSVFMSLEVSLNKLRGLLGLYKIGLIILSRREGLYSSYILLFETWEKLGFEYADAGLLIALLLLCRLVAGENLTEFVSDTES